MSSSEFVESIKSLLNGRTYHSKPLCLTLPSDIFTLIKLKWEGLSMYFSFCYMFMGRYISLTKGKLYPGLVILCNVSFEGQLKQRQVPKCSWYFMHSAKRLSHPCPAPLEVISCQFFFFCFFFFQKFLCTQDIKNQTPQRHIPSRLLQFFWRILPAAGQQARWNQTCLSPQNFNQNKVQWDGKNVNVGKTEFLCYQSNPAVVSFCGDIHPKVSCLIVSQQFSFFFSRVYLGTVEGEKWNLKRCVSFRFLENAWHKKKKMMIKNCQKIEVSNAVLKQTSPAHCILFNCNPLTVTDYKVARFCVLTGWRAEENKLSEVTQQFLQKIPQITLVSNLRSTVLWSVWSVL